MGVAAFGGASNSPIWFGRPSADRAVGEPRRLSASVPYLTDLSLGSSVDIDEDE